MLADIGNGTMNIMYINNSRPVEKKCFTEKYGTHQCVLAVRESLLKELGTVVDEIAVLGDIIRGWFSVNLIIIFLLINIAIMVLKMWMKEKISGAEN